MGEVEQLNIDLPEIQSLDPKEIIKAKFKEAQKHHPGEFIVEDVSLCLDCFSGFPGSLIKWMLKALGNEGLEDLFKRMGNDGAETRVVVGYADGKGEPKFFESGVRGKIVSPRGDLDFGWGPIFQPEGEAETYGEMSREKKNLISMRRMAFNKLKKYLEEK